MTEHIRVFIVEKKRKTSDHFDLLRVPRNLNSVFLQLVIVTEYFDRSPDIFTLFEDRGNTVEHVTMIFAMLEPLLDGSICVPAIVSGKSLHWKHVGIIKNFIFFGENSESFARSLVFVKVVFLFREEGGFLNNDLVLLDDVSMSGWQAL